MQAPTFSCKDLCTHTHTTDESHGSLKIPQCGAQVRTEDREP